MIFWIFLWHPLISKRFPLVLCRFVQFSVVSEWFQLVLKWFQAVFSGFQVVFTSFHWFTKGLRGISSPVSAFPGRIQLRTETTTERRMGMAEKSGGKWHIKMALIVMMAFIIFTTIYYFIFERYPVKARGEFAGGNGENNFRIRHNHKTMTSEWASDRHKGKYFFFCFHKIARKEAQQRSELYQTQQSCLPVLEASHEKAHNSKSRLDKKLQPGGGKNDQEISFYIRKKKARFVGKINNNHGKLWETDNQASKRGYEKRMKIMSACTIPSNTSIASQWHHKKYRRKLGILRN